MSMICQSLCGLVIGMTFGQKLEAQECSAPECTSSWGIVLVERDFSFMYVASIPGPSLVSLRSFSPKEY